MNAVDTNILLYAHRSDSEFHEPARELVLRLATDSQRWAIPWPCIYEFLAITTHHRVYHPPTPVDRALEQVRAWLSSPTVTLLSEEGDLFSTTPGVGATDTFRPRLSTPRSADASKATSTTSR